MAEWIAQKGFEMTQLKVYAAACGLLLTAGCTRLLPVDNSPCPCAEGYFCCESTQRCVADASECAACAPEVPQSARQVLDRQCHSCHGQNGTAEGGFNYVL